MKSAYYIAVVAARELVYERVFYLLVCFSGLALGLSLALGQLTYAEQAKLTLDFMLGGIEISMVLFSIFMGISLFHRELTLGSVSMILSKPIERASFIVGKFLGQTAVQFAVVASMTLITLAICSHLGGEISELAILQSVGLIFLEVTIITAVTYFFAVISGGVTTAVATLCFFGLGHLHDTFASNQRLAQGIAWRILDAILPNLEIFNMKALASYGIAASFSEVGWASVYALCCVLFFISSAILIFSRRDILT